MTNSPDPGKNLALLSHLYPGRDCLTPAEALRQVGLDSELNRDARSILARYEAAHVSGARAAARAGTAAASTSPSPIWFESAAQRLSCWRVPIKATGRLADHPPGDLRLHRRRCSTCTPAVCCLRTWKSNAMKKRARFELSASPQLQEYRSPQRSVRCERGEKIGMPRSKFQEPADDRRSSVYIFCRDPPATLTRLQEVARAAGCARQRWSVEGVQPLTC